MLLSKNKRGTELFFGNDAFGLKRNQKERLNAIATTVGYSYADLVYDSDGNEDADASRRVAVKFYLKVNG